MQTLSLRPLPLLALLAASLFGCSRDESLLTAPAPGASSEPAARLARAAGPTAVPDGWIVVFKPTVTDVDGEVDAIEQQLGVSADQRYRYALKGFAATMPASAVEALRHDPDVAYIEQDQVMRASATQSNPTWGIDRIDQRNLPLSSSYTYNQTGAGLDAYIIDTGIRRTHQEFGGRAVTGFDAIVPGGPAMDDNGHGTHVAGTVGGATYGVAKGVRLIAVKVLSGVGIGLNSQVIAGVDWVTGHHTTTPAAANMSLGGGASDALDNAVRASIADGVTYCVAAGNDAVNASTQSPARVTQAITVGATNMTDGWASFSNFGNVVDLLGPGVSITSSWWLTDTSTNTISGTSMATPHVCGTAILYLSANPTATPAQVSSGLTSSATANVITGVPSGTANRLVFSL